MINSIKLIPVLKTLCFFTFCTLFMISCGCEDETTIQELKLCDVKLESGNVECDNNLSNFSSTGEYIAASALIEAHDELTVITYSFIRSSDNAVLATGTSSLSGASEEVQESCKAWSGFYWTPTNGTWPTGDFEIKVEANTPGAASLTQRFTIN